MKAVVIASLMAAAAAPLAASAQDTGTADGGFTRSAALCERLLSQPSLPDPAEEEAVFQRSGLELMETSTTPARQRRMYAPPGWMMDGATINVERPQSSDEGLKCVVILMSADTGPVHALARTYREAQGWSQRGSVENLLGGKVQVFERSISGRTLTLQVSTSPFPSALFQINGTL